MWDAVRRAVDAGAPPGRYLLAGSAAPAKAPTHSGAGRTVNVRMRPLALAERGLAPATVRLSDLLTGARPPVGGNSPVDLAGYAREIVASGCPGFLSLAGRALRAQLDGYLARVVDRDVVEQGSPVRKPDALRRWLAAYAAATSTTTSLDKIRNAATSGEGETASKPTALAYRDVLERLYLVDPVPGWLPPRSHLARLTQAPRHRLADPALAARLLGVDEGALLVEATSPLFDADANGCVAARATAPRGGTLFGQLFESLVTLSVRVYAQVAEARVRHLREHDGRRAVDLIVERADQRVLGIEVKPNPAATDDDVRHLRWLQDALGDALLDAVVVTTGRGGTPAPNLASVRRRRRSAGPAPARAPPRAPAGTPRPRAERLPSPGRS